MINRRRFDTPHGPSSLQTNVVWNNNAPGLCAEHGLSFRQFRNASAPKNETENIAYRHQNARNGDTFVIHKNFMSPTKEKYIFFANSSNAICVAVPLVTAISLF